MENSFMLMQDRIRSSQHFAAMKRTIRPLQDYFLVNHFWYYRITKSDDYTFIGTHSRWIDHVFTSGKLLDFPCINISHDYNNSIYIMNQGHTRAYQEILKSASEQFSIFFQFQLMEINNEGISAFGFATESNSSEVVNRLFNELGLLRSFIKYFQDENAQLLAFADSESVNLARPQYDEAQIDSRVAQREALQKLLWPMAPHTRLTKRENEILPFIAKGFPASYIAEELCLSKRTVENHWASIKHKLGCESKTKLIQAAQAYNCIRH